MKCRSCGEPKKHKIGIFYSDFFFCHDECVYHYLKNRSLKGMKVKFSNKKRVRSFNKKRKILNAKS